MKKYFKILLVLTLCFTITGCKKQQNEVSPEEITIPERSEEYKYDFIDFLNIEVIGANGYGIVNIYPKDFSVDNFSNEEDYIQIKRYIDSLNPYHIYNYDYQTNLIIDKINYLANGDVVTISIPDNLKIFTDDFLNTEDYIFRVENLEEGEEIDLYSDTYVSFFNYNGTDYMDYCIKDDSSELFKNIEYYMTTEDENLEKGVSIINVEANLNEEFLIENDYPNIEVYLAKHNYICDLWKETVLDDTAVKVEFNDITNNQILTILNKDNVGNLVDANGQIYQITEVCNIQKDYYTNNDLNDFYYEVTFRAYNQEYEGAFRKGVYIYKLNDKIYVQDATIYNTTSILSLYEPISNNNDIIVQFTTTGGN